MTEVPDRNHSNSGLVNLGRRKEKFVNDEVVPFDFFRKGAEAIELTYRELNRFSVEEEVNLIICLRNDRLRLVLRNRFVNRARRQINLDRFRFRLGFVCERSLVESIFRVR